MPIHLRAEPGDYAPAVLCPGDPRRAAYVAERFLTDAKVVNEERGMLGFTGTYQGQPLSVQATGMGCPSAAIAYEELIQLGATRLIRIGTTGALQPGMAFADTVVAFAATTKDQTFRAYTDGHDHSPVADWRLVETAVRLGRERGMQLHVGPIVSSDAFYAEARHHLERWRRTGHLAIEMEASVLFTIGALRGVATLTLLTVSDLLNGDEVLRIPDDELREGVDQMMELAARVAVAPIEPGLITGPTAAPTRP
jgi:5'-methylthioadenosine phosphorylase/purine-nucleoside phosphorylase